MAIKPSLLSRLFGRIEKRSSDVLDWAEGFHAFSAGVQTDAGESIDNLRAMQIATVFSAVSIIAKAVGTLPVVVSKDKVPVGSNDALQYLLGTAPNEETPSAAAWWTAFVGNMVLCGNGLAEIQRNGAGYPVELHLLDPLQTQPWRDKDGLVYKSSETGQERVLQAADVLHVPMLSREGIWGLNPIAHTRQMLGATVAQERFAARFFANYATPHLALSVDTSVKPEDKQRMREEWQALQSGRNTHKVAVLDQGMKVQTLSISPNDAQFLETRRYSRSDIAALFGVPLHLLGDDSRLAKASTEEVNRAYYCDTLNPIISGITGAIARKILPRSPGMASEYSVKMDVSARLQGDTTAQMNMITTLRQWSVITPNQACEMLGMPSQGAKGDDLVMPSNMSIIKPDGTVQQPVSTQVDLQQEPTDEA